MVQDEHTQKEQRTAGVLLREARESAGLSIEHVADKLHLLQSVVSALEKDCYDRIRGETFVRGYMRNYARLLGIDDDEVIGRYNALRPAVKVESRFNRRRDNWHGSSGAGRVGMVLALLAFSAMFLFHNREPQAAVPVTAAEAVTIDTATGPEVIPLLSPAPARGQP